MSSAAGISSKRPTFTVVVFPLFFQHFSPDCFDWAGQTGVELEIGLPVDREGSLVAVSSAAGISNTSHFYCVFFFSFFNTSVPDCFDWAGQTRDGTRSRVALAVGRG